MPRLHLFFLLSAALAAQSRRVTEEEVMRVHRAALLIDTHNDVTSNTVEGLDIGKRRAEGHSDTPRFREGGMGAVFFAVYVAPQYVAGNRAANRTLQMIDTVRHDIIERYPNDYALATTADEILRARKSGRIAALLGIEGGHAIEDSPRLLRQFHALGVRYMTLTHTNTNSWADSSGDIKRADIKHHNGLTALGRDIIREMNRLGMIVDISHVSDKTFWDALEASRAPIFASHSSARALSNIPRNMTDEMIAALGKKGGVVQVNFGCEFLSQKSADSSPLNDPAVLARFNAAYANQTDMDPAVRRRRMREIVAELGAKTVRAKLSDAVAHIDHIVKIAGIGAVGIGSDFDGVGCVPEGLDDAAKMPNLTRALLERGYTAADIRRIYGENTLRLMRQVERVAATSAPTGSATR
ncbi:MAG: membrane dipeptidase [Acidobacteria bacterium]|nr:membrane dipeptidase [Acidobacteriota bacterium]